MRLAQLQKREFVTEGWNDSGWMLFEQKVAHPWVNSIEQAVMEANLTPDQINNIFANIEKTATNNRTALGKGVDAAKFINDKINELGRAVQKAGPVQNADAKFDQLKNKIGSSDAKVVQGIKAVSDWAKANPGKASAAVAVLTVAAAIAAGPMAGALTGFLARATKDLLKGEKLSTAVGKSLKTAAIGAVVGAIADGVKDIDISEPAQEGGLYTVELEMPEGIDAESIKLEFEKQQEEFLRDLEAQLGKDIESATPQEVAEVALEDVELQEYKMSFAEKMCEQIEARRNVDISPEMVKKVAANVQIEGNYPSDFGASYKGTWIRGNIFLTAEEAAALDKFTSPDPFAPNGILGSETTEWLKQNVEGADEYFDAQAKQFAADNPIPAEEIEALADKEIEAKIAELEADPNADPVELKQYKRALNMRELNLSMSYDGPKISEGQVYLLFNRLVAVNDHLLDNRKMFESVFDAVREAPMDTIKKAAAGAAGALKGAGKQLTTKVTADKLMSAWKKAGSPTDSAEVYKVIKSLGVNDDVIKGTYDSMKIQVPTDSEAPAADNSAELEKQIADAKQASAAKKGRGLSPEEEAQIEKEVKANFDKSKPAPVAPKAQAVDLAALADMIKKQPKDIIAIIKKSLS